MEALIVALVVVLLLATHIGLKIANKNAANSPEVRIGNGLVESPAPQATATTPNERPFAPRKRKSSRVVEITVATPLGTVTLKKPRKPVSALVVALGQSEDHLEWYFRVHRRQILERAVANLKAYQRGEKDESAWSGDYFKFIHEAPALLDNLSAERQQAVRENRDKIARKEPTILGTYTTMEQARVAARYLAEKKEPTLNAGWLQVHVVEMPSS